MGHSGRFSLTMAMRSPGRSPQVCSARAVLATFLPNSRDVIGSHFPASRYSMMRSRLRSTAAKKMSFRVAMLIASFGVPAAEPHFVFATGSEQNSTVLSLLSAMLTLTLLGTSRFTARPRQGMLGHHSCGRVNEKETFKDSGGRSGFDGDGYILNVRAN